MDMTPMASSTASALNPTKPTTLTCNQDQDALGRPMAQYDADTRKQGFEWDSAGRLISIIPPGGDVATTLKYNDVDHKGITLTRGSGDHLQVQEFRYNQFGELILSGVRTQPVIGPIGFSLTIVWADSLVKPFGFQEMAKQTKPCGWCRT
ncbi:MAG: RHS repeat protein [Holophaga sp.]|nr:RHS repeat protein [Holophaga sp.]